MQENNSHHDDESIVNWTDNAHQINLVNNAVENAIKNEVHSLLYTYDREDSETGVAVSFHVVHVQKETYVVLRRGVNHGHAYIADVTEISFILDGFKNVAGEPDEVSKADFTEDYLE